MRLKLSFCLLVLMTPVYAQQTSDQAAVMERILTRLDKIEQENQELVKEISELRRELASEKSAAKPVTPNNEGTSADASTKAASDTAELDDRVAVTEARTAEQAQTKVEAAHKYPVQLTGIVLFNAFDNSHSDTAEIVRQSNLLANSYESGATLRQRSSGSTFKVQRFSEMAALMAA